jgi:hypothetical protein
MRAVGAPCRTQGKIALLEDGHYIWEDSKPIEDPPAGE